jgi:hypothetical protein
MRPFACVPLALVFVAACAASRPPPAAPRAAVPPRPRALSLAERTYSCRGAPLPPLALVTQASGDSRLEVAIVGARARSPQETRLRVVAVQATAGALGVEVGRALGLPTSVTPEAAPVRVTLAGDVTLDQLAGLLRPHHVAFSVTMQELRVSTFYERLALATDPASPSESAMLMPRETRLVPIADGLDPIAVAAAYCRQMASSRGRVSVLGRVLLVADVDPNLRLFDRFVIELEASRRPREAPAPTPVGAGPR